jgi:hypothetical protein
MLIKSPCNGAFSLLNSCVFVNWISTLEEQNEKIESVNEMLILCLHLILLNETILIMTSKIFFSSKQKVLLHTNEVLSDMKLARVRHFKDQNRLIASQKWNMLKPGREVEILFYCDDQKVEVAVNVESNIKMLDFGASEYLEEEILIRLREKIN